MAQIQYITLDSIQEGVGASQVLAYVKKLSQKWEMSLINFEKCSDESMEELILQSNFNFEWKPLPFGKKGMLGGARRIYLLTKHINRANLIHARGDLAAFSAIIRGAKKVIWDCRALSADQRIAAKSRNKLSLEFIILRFIEMLCAKHSSRIIVITERAKEILKSRYRLPEDKFVVVSTCVDLDLFKVTPRSSDKHQVLRIAFVGTLGPQYDINLMNEIVNSLKLIIPTEFSIALSRGHTELYSSLFYDKRYELSHHEMPSFISTQDIGLSIWREDMGISLASVAATKNAEFLACGKPIVVNASQGDIGQWVENEKIGVSTKGSSSKEIASYAQQILELTKNDYVANRCQNVANKHYSLERGVELISRLYQTVIKPPKSLLD